MTQQPLYYDDFQEYAYDAAHTVPSQRMYVRNSVYLPCGELDPRTGLPVSDRAPHGRTQAKRMELNELNKRIEKEEAVPPGLRIPTRVAVALLAVAAFALGILMLTQQGNITQRQKELDKLNRQVEACQKSSELLSAQIAEASDAAKICYAAVQDLGMIPGEAAQAIYLTSVNTRPAEDGVQSVSASVPDDVQATSIPAVASSQ